MAYRITACFRMVLLSFGLQLVSGNCYNLALGMENREIHNQQIGDAAGVVGDRARLGYTAGQSWCTTGNLPGPYLLIDLETPHIICGVATQGNSRADEWVTSFTLSTSMDGNTYIPYRENRQIRVFFSNLDRNGIVKQILYDGMVGRYLRVLPKTFTSKACMRVEIYGINIQSDNIARGMPATQSSTKYNGAASRAVDGNRNTDYWGGNSCTHTTENFNTPWWQVDLGSTKAIAEIFIVNQGGQYGNRLWTNMFELHIGDNTNGASSNPKCGDRYGIQPAQSISITCYPRMNGRYVTIVLKATDALTLCEVEVYTRENIAKWKRATQSTLYKGGTAHKAVDGDLTPNYGSGEMCSHTSGTDNQPWWRVDLNQRVPVTEVYIVNRKDNDNFRLKNFEIRIGNDGSKGGVSNPKCGDVYSIPDGEVRSIYCHPAMMGRYITIRFKNYARFLTLCEVEIYTQNQVCSRAAVGVSDNKVIPNARLTSSSSWSSTYSPYKARLRYNGAWTPSSRDNKPWLQADLGHVHHVCGVATQGSPNHNDWSTKYIVALSLDGKSWPYIGNSQVFSGNRDSNSIVKHNFAIPLAAKFVRFYPTEKYSYHAMRVEVFGEPKVCFQPLGMENNAIPSYRISSSSNQNTANQGRLYGSSSWCSRTTLSSEYLQVDLGQVKTIAGIATQGDPSRNNWVTMYTVSYSYDNERWIGYKDAGSTTIKEFSGNNGRSNVVANFFNVSFAGRYIRLNPVKRRTANCLRMDLYGCDRYSAPATDPIDERTLPTSMHGSVNIPCTASGYGSQIQMEWFFGATDITNLSGGVVRTPSQAIRTLRVNYTSAEDVLSHFTCSRPGVNTREVLCSKQYTCFASYDKLPGGGMTKQQAKVLATLRLPGRPISLSVNDKRSRSVTLAWTAPLPEDGEGSIINHIISFVNISNKEVINTRSPGTTYPLMFLKPYTEYGARVKAVSKVGDGLWSIQKNFRTSQAAPSAPRKLTYTTGLPHKFHPPNLTLAWQLPLELNGIITSYLLSYNRSSGYYGISAEVIITDTTELTYSMRMIGGFKYFFWLQAKTIYIGPPTRIVTLQTPEYVPSSAPGNVTIPQSDGLNHTICWTAIPLDESNGHVIVYEISWSLSHRTKVVRSVDPETAANTTSTSFTLQGLPACSFYRITIRGYTKVGPGPFSDPIILETSEPDAPQNLAVVQTRVTEVVLEWEAPDTKGASINSYMISLIGSKSYDPSFAQMETRVQPIGSATTFTVSDLTPATRYEFSVLAVTDCGEGEHSTRVQTETDITNPLAPIIPFVQFINGSVSGKANITVRPTKSTNGPISAYQILIIEGTTESDGPSPEYTPFDPNTSGHYICAQLTSDAVGSRLVFTVGDGNNYNGYENTPLQKGKSYRAFERAVTTTSEKLFIGKAALVARITMPKEELAKPRQQAQGTGAEIAAFVLVPLLVIIILVIAVVILRRRNQSHRAGKTSRDQAPNEDNSLIIVRETIEMGSRSNPIEIDEPSCAVSVDTSPTPEPADNIYSEPINEANPGPIPAMQFAEYFNRVKQNNNIRLNNEFKKLFSSDKHTSDVAKKRANKIKNRYANIVTYDHSRVVLEKLAGDQHSDYINASYLRDFDDSPKAYLATQGPVDQSCDDFWRMMWQENCSIIIMLTGLIEGRKRKCHQYWPDKERIYGQLIIALQESEVFADYTVRTFVASKEGQSEQRYIYQYHFTVWPDKGVPQYATAVLGLRKKIMNESAAAVGPWVIHCSAGVGRTGAFLVIDAMLRQAKAIKTVDIFNYLRKIREDRPHMVQTQEQYVFIHLAVLEALVCGSTDIRANDLQTSMTKLAMIRRHESISGYELEFKRLSVIVSSDVPYDDISVGLKPCNATKNRFPGIIPLDARRVVLKSPAKREGSDYINASFANAYREKNAYILTQAPLEETISSFWHMIYDYGLGTIVMLNDLTEGDECYPQYWPSVGTVDYGKVVVEMTEEDKEKSFTSRRFSISAQSACTQGI